MDQNEARAIIGQVFSRGTGAAVFGTIAALFIVCHLFVAAFGLADLDYCNVRPGRLQLFQIFGPVLAYGIFVGLRAAIPGQTQIPRIVAWSLIAVIVGIDCWYLVSRGSVVLMADLYHTNLCKFAQSILPFERPLWSRY